MRAAMVGLAFKLTVYTVTQAAALATAVVAVVHSSLGPFAQALIIAMVGAIISALGLVVAAVIAANEARRSREEIRAAHGGRRKDELRMERDRLDPSKPEV